MYHDYIVIAGCLTLTLTFIFVFSQITILLDSARDNLSTLLIIELCQSLQVTISYT